MPVGQQRGGRKRDVAFPGADRTALDRAALAIAPTDQRIYPLPQTGERFPINDRPWWVSSVMRQRPSTCTPDT